LRVIKAIPVLAQIIGIQYLLTSNLNPFNKHYSPNLYAAWDDQPVSLNASVWFIKESYIDDLHSLPITTKIDITQRVLDNIERLQTINKIKTII
jgi:hypothetical protein